MITNVVPRSLSVSKCSSRRFRSEGLTPLWARRRASRRPVRASRSARVRAVSPARPRPRRPPDRRRGRSGGVRAVRRRGAFRLRDPHPGAKPASEHGEHVLLTVRSSNGDGIWKVRASPRRRFRRVSTRSRPSVEPDRAAVGAVEPGDGVENVDFPEPFGPMMPWIVSSSTVTESLSFATSEPNRLVSPSVSKIGRVTPERNRTCE